MPDAATWALGIDVGNAKLKVFALRVTGVARHYAAALPWSGRDPYNRKADFEGGISAALAPILADLGTSPACAVAVMSNGYSYPTHQAGASHTLNMLASALPDTDVRALAWNGELYSSGMEDAQLGLLACTNGAGAVHLARRCEDWPGRNGGLVMDVGGTTTALTPIIDGRVDPVALADPDCYLDHRVRHGKLAWIGSRTTPVESLLHEVTVGDRRYPVIPRGVTMHEVMALLELLPADRESPLRMFQSGAGSKQLLRAMADAIGIDGSTVSEDELKQLARDFHQRAIEKLAGFVRQAVATATGCERQVLVFGVAARALGLPALLSAGIESAAITFAEDMLSPKLCDIASVYGAAHVALEHVLGRDLEPAFAARRMT